MGMIVCYCVRWFIPDAYLIGLALRYRFLITNLNYSSPDWKGEICYTGVKNTHNNLSNYA